MQTSGDACGDCLIVCPLKNSHTEQSRMMVIVAGYTLFVTSQRGVISEDCFSVDGDKPQPFSIGVGLRQWCVLPKLLFIVYIRFLRTIRPTRQIRLAKPFYPAAKHILPIMKKIYI